MSETMRWPRHAGGLFVSHNEHVANHMTVAQAIDAGEYSRDDFPDDADIAQCLATESVWRIQWYPNTPNGFYTVCAATFERALAFALAVDDAP